MILKNINQRIIGIDVARALAIIGMIIVNFKIVLGDKGLSWVKSVAGIFDGKAAATFVVLAGVGLAMMTQSARRSNDREKMRDVRFRIIKKAVFLFIVGLSYLIIWPGDILHFYGVYMLITLFFLRSKSKTILITALTIIIIYPLLLIFINYETGWNFDTLEYLDHRTFEGFFRNLLFNGFHPIIPWTAFMLFGLWFGQQNLHDTKFVRKAFLISLLTFIAVQAISSLSITILSGGNEHTTEELISFLGTNPMPPLPMYMLNGISIAIVVISACILLANRFESNMIIQALNKTGQLALSFYVAHVVIGMGIIEIFFQQELGKYSIQFSMVYALFFCLMCVTFAVIWMKHKNKGPLEWVMRKLTD